jgi:hypothetical protein
MADKVNMVIIYPPNFDGFFDPAGYLKRGLKHAIFQLTNISDGTGETAVRKMARGDLFGPSGLPCKRMCIEEIAYHTFGMGVHLFWDMVPDETIVVLPQNGSGLIKGPFLPKIARGEDYEPGATGDLMLTTIAAANNDTYNIVIKMRIKEV